MNRNLILIGIIVIAIGIFWPFLEKFPLGRLPGDIYIKKEGFRFFLPITSCLLVSVIVSLLFYLFRK